MSRLVRSDKTKQQSSPDSGEVLPLTSETITKHLKTCQSTVVDYARSAFHKYLEDLDEAFNVDIDNARTNQEVSEISGIQRLFRRNRDELERYYCGYIGEGFVKFKKKELNTVLDQSGGSELTLVDNEDLEETITISSATQKMDVYYAEPIWALNPAAPIQFCESLRRALRLIPLTQKAKATAYRVYEEKLSDLVKRVVETTNEYLRKAGVLPNLKYTPPRSGPKSTPQDETSSASQDHAAQPFVERRNIIATTPDPSQPSEQYQSSLVHAIRGLQQSMGGGPRPVVGRRATDVAARAAPGSAMNAVFGGGIPITVTGQPGAGGGEGAGVVGGTPGSMPAGPGAPAGVAGAGAPVVISGDQLMSALHALQATNAGPVSGAGTVPQGQALAPLNIQGVLQGLAEQIQTSTESGNARVSEGDMGTIDLVGMVFDYMLSDENLPVSVKALLSYLHTPFLKLAFIDPGFFEQSEHPARMLLNNLAEAGIKWVGNDGTDQYEMYAKIKEVVDKVLTEFKNDIRVITELLLEFNSYTKNIVRRQELTEKRATEKVQGEERLREVKIRVNEEVMAKTDGNELPSAVLLFLLQPWSDFLSFTLLRYSESSGKWERALSLIDDLIWVIEPKEAEADQVRQAELRTSLAKEIQAGFETIGYDQTKGNQLVRNIVSLIEMAQQREKVEPAPAPMRTKLEKIAEEKAGKITDDSVNFTEDEQKMVESLRMMEFGTWFEFEDGKRVKVAWFNARTSNYMMVDQKGKKVDMMSGLDALKL